MGSSRRNRIHSRPQFYNRGLCLAAFIIVFGMSQSLRQAKKSAPVTLEQRRDVIEHSDNRFEQLKPGLPVPPHVIAHHNATIAIAHRALLQGATGGDCAANVCDPFRDIHVGLPGLVNASKQDCMVVLPNRKNCVIYSVTIASSPHRQRDGSVTDFGEWEAELTNMCPEVHVFECAASTQHQALKNKGTLIVHPQCIGPLASNYSLLSTMKQFRHVHIDVLKVVIHTMDLEILSKQLEAILPPQVVLQLYISRIDAEDVISGPSVGTDADRRVVDEFMLRLYDMGYRVSGLRKWRAMTQISLIAVVLKKDTVFYDRAGDCPDELSIC